MNEILAALITGVFSVIMMWMTYRLNQIHTLVNSNMSRALEDGLASMRVSRYLMGEVIDLKRAAGHEPSVMSLAALAALEEEIRKAEITVAGRRQMLEQGRRD